MDRRRSTLPRADGSLKEVLWSRNAFRWLASRTSRTSTTSALRLLGCADLCACGTNMPSANQETPRIRWKCLFCPGWSAHLSCSVGGRLVCKQSFRIRASGSFLVEATLGAVKTCVLSRCETVCATRWSTSSLTQASLQRRSVEPSRLLVLCWSGELFVLHCY